MGVLRENIATSQKQVLQCFSTQMFHSNFGLMRLVLQFILSTGCPLPFLMVNLHLRFCMVSLLLILLFMLLVAWFFHICVIMHLTYLLLAVGLVYFLVLACITMVFEVLIRS